MSQSNLIVHCGGRIVTREELDKVEAPSPTKTWFPQRHSSVVDAVASSLNEAQFTVRKVQYALARNDHRMFCCMDLDCTLISGVSLAVGIRNSTDKKFPLGFVAGSRTFICDNLAFRGEILVTKRHTRHGQTRFVESIRQATTALSQFKDAEAARIKRFRVTEVTPAVAESLILRAWEKDIVSHRLVPNVLKEFREPTHEEFAENGFTLWRLEQAFTSTLGPVFKSNPQGFVNATMSLQGLLGEVAGVRPEEAFQAQSA